MAGVLSRFRSGHRAYEPSSRYCHLSTCCRGRVVLWGGVAARDDVKNRAADIRKAVEFYDPFFERWEQQLTTGASPPSLFGSAEASVMDLLYAFGGKDGRTLYITGPGRIGSTESTCLWREKFFGSKMNLAVVSKI